ncbi:PIN domain-containing protein [Xanthomonas campestris]|uniref:PIN domain-containing protein n=1 Tax=Xanthomonas campestris TaxID=339 RepID=UPI002378AB18|nr:PIN domain-containing protein [Xanthomonas campestris]WDL55845.1 hypothetical protein JH263_07720 [Xanthomonas campestris pv. campestris]
MSDILYLIPDTNVLLQCRAFEELPWRDLYPSAKQIVLVLITPVVRETDRQKGGQGRLANRARRVNSWIGELLDTDELLIRPPKPGPGVKVISADAVQPDPALSHTLNFDHADDAIVGTVAAFKEAHPENDVVLLSRDNAVLLSAKRVGVAYQRAPEDWLLPAESNEDQKRIKALEGELARLKQSEPECVIDPSHSPWDFEIERFEPLTEDQIRALMGSLAVEFPPESDFAPAQPSARRPTVGKTLFPEEFTPPSKEEIEHYQKVIYPQWLEGCEEAWKTLHEKLNAKVPCPQISVNVHNKGSRPAEDVWVQFALKSEGVLLVLPKTEEEPISFETGEGMSVEVRLGHDHVWLPGPPSAPRGKWIKRYAFDPAGSRVQPLDHFVQVKAESDLAGHLRPPEPRNPNSFYYEPGMRPGHPRPSTKLTCTQFRHQAEPKTFLFELFTVRSQGRELTTGALAVELHAANLSSPVKATIPFNITFTSGPTSEEAEAILESLRLRSKKKVTLILPSNTAVE